MASRRNRVQVKRGGALGPAHHPTDRTLWFCVRWYALCRTKAGGLAGKGFDFRGNSAVLCAPVTRRASLGIGGRPKRTPRARG